MKTRLVYYAHFSCALPECWQRQSDCRIINITCYKNVISMKRSARRPKMYVLRCMHAVLTWLTDPWLTPKLRRISKAISYATKALGYSELRPNQELAVKHFLRGHDVFVSLACPQAVAKAFATAFFPRPFTFYGRGLRAPSP